jgi:RNA polymerase sigma-70 factor, ECF subfamily
MAKTELDETLLDAACESWNHFLTQVDGLRPALFRYCRALTGNVWDAEDLVQDTLEKGFAKLGSVTTRSTTRAPTCCASPRTCG